MRVGPNIFFCKNFKSCKKRNKLKYLKLSGDGRSLYFMERKVRTPQSGIPIERSGSLKAYGKCHRKQTAARAARVKRRGKSPPRFGAIRPAR